MSCNLKERIIRLEPIARLLRKRNPDHAVCPVCGVPYSHAIPHTISFFDEKTGKDGGFFAVCEYCHKKANVFQLAAAYEHLWRVKWKGIEKPFSYTAFKDKYIKDIGSREK